jgi:hypothetical protein
LLVGELWRVDIWSKVEFSWDFMTTTYEAWDFKTTTFFTTYEAKESEFSFWGGELRGEQWTWAQKR